MIIKRDYYLQQLISSKSNNLIKIVTGIRRSGKSFLLFNLFHNHLIETGVSEDHIIEIALDDRLNKNLRDPDVILQHIHERIVDDKLYYIILDEVQMIDEFTDVLNSLCISATRMCTSREATPNFYPRMWSQSFGDVVMKSICSHCLLLNYTTL